MNGDSVNVMMRPANSSFGMSQEDH